MIFDNLLFVKQGVDGAMARSGLYRLYGSVFAKRFSLIKGQGYLGWSDELLPIERQRVGKVFVVIHCNGKFSIGRNQFILFRIDSQCDQWEQQQE